MVLVSSHETKQIENDQKKTHTRPKLVPKIVWHTSWKPKPDQTGQRICCNSRRDPLAGLEPFRPLGRGNADVLGLEKWDRVQTNLEEYPEEAQGKGARSGRKMSLNHSETERNLHEAPKPHQTVLGLVNNKCRVHTSKFSGMVRLLERTQHTPPDVSTQIMTTMREYPHGVRYSGGRAKTWLI